MNYILMLLCLRKPLDHTDTIGVWQFPHLQSPAMLLVFALLLIAGGVLAWNVYRHEPNYVSNSRKRLLSILRLSAYLVMLFMFSGAMIELTHQEGVKGNLMVLVDASRSMGIVDRRSKPDDIEAAVTILGTAHRKDLDSATRSDLIKAACANSDIDPIRKLDDRFTIEGFTFGEKAIITPLELAPVADPRGILARLQPPTEDATQLGSALMDAKRRAKGQDLDGIIVITDGGSNRGEDPLISARAIGVPIYAVGIGLPLDRELAIPFISCDDVVFKDDRFLLNVRIQQRGYSGRATTLVIKRIDENKNEEVVKEEPIVLPDEFEHMHTVELVPDQAGIFTYVAEIAPFADQGETRNNHRAKSGIRVVDKKIRVLLVDDNPRYEFRFLKSILDSDKQRIAPTYILRHGESLGHGSLLVRRFPSSVTDMHNFDVVILGDIGSDFFNAEEMKALEAFVHQDGGGLIAIAGDSNMPTSYMNSALLGMLPVEVDPITPMVANDDLYRTISDNFRVQVTPDGARWSALRFAQDPAENERDWDQCEPMTWYYPSRALKPGATTYLIHPERSMGDVKMPILSGQRYGMGQVLFFASDEDWRWRFLPGTAPHRRFWGQLISAVGMTHLLGASDRIQIETEHAEYALGDHVQIIARVRDVDFNPLNADSVPVTIEHDLSRSTIELSARENQPGVFSGEWVPTSLGTTRISIENSGESSDHVVTIATPRIEFDDVGQHQDLLRRMAQFSGGQYLPLERIGELNKILHAKAQASNPRHSQLTLWNAPGVLLMLAALLGSEWFLRKRSDLL